MIPKIIHTFWLGKAQMPVEQVAFINGWSKICPDYEIKIWKDDDIAPYLEDCAYVNRCLKLGKYAFLSDYLRLVILYRFGGIYLDTDVELKKNLDIFLNHKCFGGFIFDSSIGTAVMGSEKNNSILIEWKDYLIKNFDATWKFVVNNDWMTKYFLDNFSDFRLNGKRQSLKCGIELYPKDYFERYQINKKSGGGYAEHHCVGSWNDEKESAIKKLVKKILPRSVVSYLGHKKFIKTTPYYKVYLEHLKEE